MKQIARGRASVVIGLLLAAQAVIGCDAGPETPPDGGPGVVRVSTGGTPARSQVGRTAVADCPALADLPRLVRRGGGS